MRILNFIGAFVVSFGIAMVGTAVVFTIFNWEMTKAAVYICMFIIIAICMVVYYNFKGNSEGCPKCGKKFAMKEISRKTVGSEATTMDVKQEIRNKKGEVTGTYTQTVPATRFIHDCVDECKYCGFRREVQRDTVYKD